MLEFSYYQSFGHDNLIFDLSRISPVNKDFMLQYITVFDGQNVLDWCKSFHFTILNVSHKPFQRALYFLNQSILTTRLYLGFPQIFYKNDNQDLVAINFLLNNPSTHIHIFNNTPPRKDVNQIIAEVKYYLNYSKYFQIFIYHNSETEKAMQPQSPKSKRKSKQKSKSKTKSKSKSKRKTKSKLKSKSKTKSKSNSKRKTKSKSKSKRKTKSKTKSKQKSKSKTKSKTKSKQKSKSKTKSKTKSKQKSKKKANQNRSQKANPSQNVKANSSQSASLRPPA
jgi:RNA polymerase-associated protein CTR9/transcription factor SPN1